MKILYGVQGTGNGHIARARRMAEALKQRSDIEVDFVFSGRPANKYFDMEVFGEFRTLTGLSFITRHGKVDKLATLRQARMSQLVTDIRKLDVSSYNLLVNDFEPVTAWAAKNNGVPSISISHQAAFAYPVPKAGDTLTDRLLMKYFAPTDIQLGVHWFHFNQPILPPFIAEKLTAESLESHVLVYLPFEEINDIQHLLEPLTDQTFLCYHPAVTEPLDCGHIQWRPPSKKGFQQALIQSQGVIANAGFELSSEALQLGKKLLIKPLHGQFEQLSNVLMLNRLELCQTLFSLDTDAVEEWLEAPATEAICFPDDPSPLIDWLAAGNWHETRSLCSALWEQVRFGDKTRERLQALAI